MYKVNLKVVDTTEQQYSSKATSINAKKAPNIFKRIHWEENGCSLDIGGGKYDTATEYLKTMHINNFIYDPYNRNEENNRIVLYFINNCSNFNTVTISNVLNVIAEKKGKTFCS